LPIAGAGAGAISPKSWAETPTLANIAITRTAAKNFIVANSIEPGIGSRDTKTKSFKKCTEGVNQILSTQLLILKEMRREVTRRGFYRVGYVWVFRKKTRGAIENVDNWRDTLRERKREPVWVQQENGWWLIIWFSGHLSKFSYPVFETVNLTPRQSPYGTFNVVKTECRCGIGLLGFDLAKWATHACIPSLCVSFYMWWC